MYIYIHMYIGFRGLGMRVCGFVFLVSRGSGFRVQLLAFYDFVEG